MMTAIIAAAVTSGQTFADDVAFLSKHTDVVVLKNAAGASVAVVPAYQGRVMTSAASAKSAGNGWINYDLIASGKMQAHIMPYGGEDRLWLGPEGGQFSIFFPAGAKFDLEHWQTPAIIDTEPFEVVSKSSSQVTVQKDGVLKNYSDTEFTFTLTRTVRLLDPAALKKHLGVTAPKGVSVVAYESDNQVKNRGTQAWTKDTGLPSIWILGMLKHSPTTTVIAPVRPGPTSELGPMVNDAYFGKVPNDRLKATKTHVFFRADGQKRSKIGFSPKRAMPVIGSYDPKRGLLTIVQFTIPKGATDYVNSMWELQDKPFAGDVSNSYNDGPPAPGAKPLGPFYELESSSPAQALAPGATGRHFHRTFHFTGSRAALQAIAKKVLNCDLKPLESPNFWKSK